MSNLRRYLSADGENASVSDPFHGILITMETRPRGLTAAGLATSRQLRGW